VSWRERLVSSRRGKKEYHGSKQVDSEFGVERVTVFQTLKIRECTPVEKQFG
jgi:hypothetical protein